MADSSDSENITPLHQIISSCTGALLTSVFVTPLDVVKIRLQAQQKTNLNSSKCFLYCNGFMEELCCNFHSSTRFATPYWYRSSAHFTGTVDAFIKIRRAEGITSLWSGLSATILMAVPGTVIYYTLYDQILYSTKKHYKWTHQPLWLPIVAGGAARVFAVTVVSPLELVRTKMQSQKLNYLEIGHAVKKQISTKGFRSMWHGLGPTLLRDVPFSAIYWFNYEYFKQTFNQQKPTFGFSFFAGAISGGIAAFLTLPFDVIKTHQQIELGEALFGTHKQTKSTYILLRNLYQINGYKALFAGIVPRTVKIAPSCAIMISTYEYGKQFFQNYNASKAASTF
ncbi:solute carrier family 25 member 40 [Trichonephila clavata]|uniref:Solute carrier family 25 member 40 n=1 Tax=Trichonephila clavata TaxID=2740835 RepID=A0A8X6JVH2_TRICU|nr:solute carrier family 25 member 40 [Trichonephila clavata]